MTLDLVVISYCPHDCRRSQRVCVCITRPGVAYGVILASRERKRKREREGGGGGERERERERERVISV